MKVKIYKPELPPYADVEPDIREMYESGMLYPSVFTERLENYIKNYCQASFVVPVTSCSLGLILVLNSIPKGSKVILPSFTFNATLQALEWNDHIPLVVDVDLDGQLDPDKVKDALKHHPDVKAIVPVHMWGNACYPEEYTDIQTSTEIPVIFDGAHVLGTTYKGQHLPSFGSGVVYSVASTKPVSAGEGGLFVTNDERLAFLVKEYAAHGLIGSLDTRTRGINGKIQEFNSILAYHALLQFDKTKARRAFLMEKYRTAFDKLPVRVWKTREHVDPSYKDCVIFVEDKKVRDRLEIFLNSRGIETKKYFHPAVPDMGSFQGEVHSSAVGRDLADKCLTLPLYPALTAKEQAHVVYSVSLFFEG